MRAFWCGSSSVAALELLAAAAPARVVAAELRGTRRSAGCGAAAVAAAGRGFVAVLVLDAAPLLSRHAGKTAAALAAAAGRAAAAAPELAAGGSAAASAWNVPSAWTCPPSTGVIVSTCAPLPSVLVSLN